VVPYLLNLCLEFSTRGCLYSNVSELMSSTVNSFCRFCRYLFANFFTFLRFAETASQPLKIFFLMFLTFSDVLI